MKNKDRKKASYLFAGSIYRIAILCSQNSRALIRLIR